MVGPDGAALAIRLRIAARHAEASGEGREAVVVVEGAVLLHIDDHVLDRGSGFARRHGVQRARPRRCKPGETKRARPLEERPASDWLIESELVHVPSLLVRL